MIDILYSFKSSIGIVSLRYEMGNLYEVKLYDKPKLRRDKKTEDNSEEMKNLIIIENQITEYLAGQRHQFELDCYLDWLLKEQDYSQKGVYGTPFQKAVWQTLMKIPYGECRSYSDMAEKAGCPKAVRAVANAIGANPLIMLVPCHRVIRKNGQLGGFSEGLIIKKLLLKVEGQPYLPKVPSTVRRTEKIDFLVND